LLKILTHFQTGNSFELKFVPVFTSFLDLWHNALTSLQFTKAPSTFAIILSIVDTMVHDNSFISQNTGLSCLLTLGAEVPRDGDEFIVSVAPDCT